MEIGKLTQPEGKSYMSFKDAKRQIRDMAKSLDLEIGTFRPRSENKKVLQVSLKDGTGVITAERKIGALVTVVKEMSGDDIPADILAEVLAQSSNKVKTDL